jgi:hypothetical protein
VVVAVPEVPVLPAPPEVCANPVVVSGNASNPIANVLTQT